MNGQRRSGYPKRRAEEPLSDALSRPRATGGGFSLRPAGEQPTGYFRVARMTHRCKGKGAPFSTFGAENCASSRFGTRRPIAGVKKTIALPSTSSGFTHRIV